MSNPNTYREQIEAELRAEAARLKEIQSGLRHVFALSRAAAQEELSRLDGQLATVRAKASEFAGTGGEALKELKTGMEKAVADLAEARKKASAKFHRSEP